jgi:hypothetical protein
LVPAFINGVNARTNFELINRSTGCHYRPLYQPTWNIPGGLIGRPKCIARPSNAGGVCHLTESLCGAGSGALLLLADRMIAATTTMIVSA